MPRIAAAQRVLPVAAGETLLDVLNRAPLPLGQSCGGEGVCRSCAVRVVFGAEVLSPPTALERRARALDLEGGWRLACQASTTAGADPEALIALWNPAWGVTVPPR
ncbi:MAG: 2Fe-2S iron-sulfur cluster-binding protein [Nannocystaceae bacterium]